MRLGPILVIAWTANEASEALGPMRGAGELMEFSDFVKTYAFEPKTEAVEDDKGRMKRRRRNLDGSGHQSERIPTMAELAEKYHFAGPIKSKTRMGH